MNQAHYHIVNASPDNPPVTDTEPDSAITAPHSTVIGSKLLQWLAHFTLYLGAVAVVFATGLYFLWQIPVPQDLSQLLKGAGSSSSKSSTATVAPATPPKFSTGSLQPLANSATPSDTPIATAATTPSTTSPEADSDPNAPPLVVESPTVNEPPPVVKVEEKPVETPPPLTPQAEVAELLAQAQQQMDSRRLTAPSGSNALRSYQRILELEPDNAAARAGIDQIVAYYRNVAEKSLRQGRPDESLAYVGRGLRAMPQNQDLLNLRRQARLIQRQREQAQHEEMRRQQAEQELAERQYQERLRQQQTQESPQPWWQQPPTYNNNSSGFNQR